MVARRNKAGVCRRSHASSGKYYVAWRKTKTNELPEQAVYRGLREELGVRAVTGLYYTGENEAVVESRDYPGLGLRLTRYDYVATIPPQEFCSDGYVEAQPDKTTHFVWQRL